MSTPRRALLLLALLAAPGRAAAQYVVVTPEDQMASLREVIAEVESGRQMIIAPFGALGGWGAMAMIPRDRVGAMAGYLVFSGQLHPDSLASWTREQIRISAGALQAMKGQLAELEARSREPSAPAALPPPAVVPPVQATGSWQVAGTWGVNCKWNDPDIKGSSDGGGFSLTVAPSGDVTGNYQSSGSSYPVGGRVSPDGRAGGQGAGAGWSIGWSGSIIRAASGSGTGSGVVEVTITDFGGGACSGQWSIP